MCTLEELPIYEEDEHGQNITPKSWPEEKRQQQPPPNPLATPQDRDEILLLMAQNNMNESQLADGIKTRHHQGQLTGATFADLTNDDAQSIINGLRALATTDKS